MTGASREAFDRRVDRALGDPVLQEVISSGQDYMQALQEQAKRELDWPAWLDAIEAVRSHTIANLDYYVAQFADNVERLGGRVYFAADAAEARDYVAALVKRKGAKLVVKSKSMVTEEIELLSLIHI